MASVVRQTAGGQALGRLPHCLSGAVMPAIVFLLFFLSPVAFGAEARVEVPLADSPSFGPANAPVTIIEFIDFQ
jgi:hypothetical protein